MGVKCFNIKKCHKTRQFPLNLPLKLANHEANFNVVIHRQLCHYFKSFVYFVYLVKSFKLFFLMFTSHMYKQ